MGQWGLRMARSLLWVASDSTNASRPNCSAVSVAMTPCPPSAVAVIVTFASVTDAPFPVANAPFAPVPLAWLQYLGADHARLNQHGGAIALGHPLGASGTKLMATLLGVLDATGGKYGLQTMCEGGGQANVTIIERL